MSISALHRPPFRLNPLVRGLAFALALGSGALAFAPARGVAAPVARPWVPLADASSGPPTRPAVYAPRDPRTMRSAAPPELPTGSIPVTNCDDSGPGSLRDAVLSAASGQTIDLTNTGCSLITLTTGAIGIGQAALTLQGPTSEFLEISGNNNYQVLFHSGAGTLVIDHLALAAGRKYQTDAQVSCRARRLRVFSRHALCQQLASEVLRGRRHQRDLWRQGRCALRHVGHRAVVQLGLRQSGLFDGVVRTWRSGLHAGNPEPRSQRHQRQRVQVARHERPRDGRRHRSAGAMLVKYSTLDGNTAYGPNFASLGGGIYGIGDSTIENSTVSNNSAEEAGGILLASASPSTELTILSSTISGNSATVHAGVCVFFNPNTRIANSTIAFNGSPALFLDGDGVYAYQATVDLESTIIARNSNNGFPDDVTVAAGGTFIGANNLIYEPWATVPSDTIEGLDPELLALADNGGPTATHALSLDSPAIDMGNDNAAVNYDQRGPGYPRTIGASVDIGAFEADTDTIFANGFD